MPIFHWQACSYLHYHALKGVYVRITAVVYCRSTRSPCKTCTLESEQEMQETRVSAHNAVPLSLFMLTSIPVAAFDFCQAFHDPVRQHSPKLVRISVDSCFKTFWPVSGLFFFPCAQDVGCSAPGFLLVVAFLGRLRESLVFAFLCKLTAARTVFCLLLSCGYWRIEKEMPPVVLYHAGELCLALFLNVT